jgi:hypothetical protein
MRAAEASASMRTGITFHRSVWALSHRPCALSGPERSLTSVRRTYLTVGTTCFAVMEVDLRASEVQGGQPPPGA